MARGAAIAPFPSRTGGRSRTPRGVHGKKEQGSHWPGELGDSSRAAGGISSMWLGPKGERGEGTSS